MGLFNNISELASQTHKSVENLRDDLTTPVVRLGVTGLSRAGKTIFITSLLHNLIEGGRLALFDAHANGRIIKAELEPQPDDDIPTFNYRKHVKDLVDKRVWPSSTNQISEIRLTLTFESQNFWTRQFASNKLHLDIVDYPGEWLLDLILLDMDYETWAARSIELMSAGARKSIAKNYLQFLDKLDSSTNIEEAAEDGSAIFKTYLADCRKENRALFMLPPGRFLMPGDLDGSPALTFLPLPAAGIAKHPELAILLKHRFDAYKTHIVEPFFKTHFSKIDRQIVLVDVLHALNSGPEAIHDLQETLGNILKSFRPGRNSWLSSLLGKRVERILFAATKADHVHHDDHDRLASILDHLLEGAAQKANDAKAEIKTHAIAAIQATKESHTKLDGETVPVIIGTPLKGEVANGETYDGTKEIVLFPGDLPENPNEISDLNEATTKNDAELNPLMYMRFKPPKLETTAEGTSLSLPHIRLDRTLEFLLGDKLA